MKQDKLAKVHIQEKFYFINMLKNYLQSQFDEGLIMKVLHTKLKKSF